MSQRSIRGVLGASLLALAVLVVLLVRSLTDTAPPPDGEVVVATGASAPAPSAPVLEALPAPPPLPAWHALRALVGSYQMTVEAGLTSTGLHARDGKLVLRAAVDVGVDVDGAGDGWLAGRLREVRVTGDAALVTALGVPADAGRAYAFALKTGAQGEVVEQRFDPAMPVGLRNTLASAVVGLQVARGPEQQTSRWSRIEAGTDAPLQVQYSDDGAGTITKTWTRGTAEAAPGGPRGHGRSTLVFDGVGLARAEYGYTLQVDLTLAPQATDKHSVTTTIRLGRRDAGAHVAPAAVRLADLRTAAQLEAAHRKARRAERHSAVAPISARSVTEVLTASAHAHAARRWQERRQATLELAGIVGADPVRRQEVLSRLRAPGLDGDELRTLVEALVSAGPGPARAAFAATLTDDGIPRIARHSLLSAVTFMGEPGPAVLDNVRTIVDDRQSLLRVPAAFALAAQGRVQQDRNPALGAELKADVLARAGAVLSPDPDAPTLSPLPNDDERDMWIQALGNLGGADIWPLVASHVTSQRDRRRLYAIEALRWVPLVVARVALAKAMLLDPEPRNRRRAAEVALYHPQQAMLEPVRRALREDPAGIVRIGAAQTIATWGVTSPALNEDIEEAIARETIPQVRRILRGLRPETLPDTTGMAQ